MRPFMDCNYWVYNPLDFKVFHNRINNRMNPFTAPHRLGEVGGGRLRDFVVWGTIREPKIGERTTRNPSHDLIAATDLNVLEPEQTSAALHTQG
jgi:hypothetical protein